VNNFNSCAVVKNCIATNDLTIYRADMVSVLNAVDDDDDITKCSKCRQLITDPKTLPCLDSLCAQCFTEVCDAEGMAECPRCKFRLPTSDLQTQPDRGFVDTLVALKKITNENMEDDKCDVCKQVNLELVAAAEHYCIECRQRMCAGCAKPHRGYSLTKNHSLVRLGLDSAREVLNKLKSLHPACDNHKDRYASVHCYQCSKGLCSQCQNMHFSHELVILTGDTYSHLTNTVKSLSDQLHQLVDARKEETDRVQRLLFDRRNRVEVAEKVINDKADEIISVMDKQRYELLSVLHSRNEQSVSGLETDSARLSSALAANKMALKFAEELLDKGSVEDMLLNYRMLNNRVTRLRHMSADSSVLDDSVYNDVSPTSVIHEVCTSLDSQSKSCII